MPEFSDAEIDLFLADFADFSHLSFDGFDWRANAIDENGSVYYSERMYISL